MTEDLGKFMDHFAELVQLAQSGAHRFRKGEQLIDVLTEHLGVPAHELPVVVEVIPRHRYVDADILLAGLAEEDPEHRLVGIGGGDHRHHAALSDMLQHAQMYAQFPLAQPDYSNSAVGPSEQRQTVALGVWLFKRGGSPVAVLQREASPRYGRESAQLEVLSAEPAAGTDLLAELRARMQTFSVLKGQVVSLTMDDFGSSGAGVTFHERPDLTDADVILPAGVMDRIARHAVGIAENRDVLRRLGQHLKRGILLYGPPGTGKTHTVRYLLSQSAGTTAIILSGGSLAFISEAARMARALQPSMVILEDCDLIAEDRSFGHGPQPLLFEVLDAMDGLDDDADVTFLLTTNRVDMLERALAQRPGRVDLAVEIPLPGTAERAALLGLYGRELAFSREAIADAAERTAGTTASFTKELVRRTALAAALDGAEPGDAHLRSAVEDLMSDNAVLTRSLLGSSPEGGGDGRLDEDGFGAFMPPPPGPGMQEYS
jgi:hypothetical protein